MSDADVERRGVAAVLAVLAAHYRDRPDPAAVAASHGLDPAEFGPLFRRLTGVSLDRFIDLLPLTDIQALMTRSRLRMATPTTPSALAITVWTPRPSQPAPVIRWGRHASPFGPVLAAVAESGSCAPGLCRLGFDGDDATGPVRLTASWPEARLIEEAAATSQVVAHTFRAAGQPNDEPPVSIVLRGTRFQVSVWHALAAIPAGAVVGYQDIAAAIGQLKAARAVGSAVGSNPIAVLIPCHRVILASGALHHYGWGPERKRALLAWELAAFGGQELGPPPPPP